MSSALGIGAAMASFGDSMQTKFQKDREAQQEAIKYQRQMNLLKWQEENADKRAQALRDWEDKRTQEGRAYAEKQIGDERAYTEGQKLKGYLNGVEVTAAELANMTPEQQASVQSVGEYELGLEKQKKGIAADAQIGVDKARLTEATNQQIRVLKENLKLSAKDREAKARAYEEYAKQDGQLDNKEKLFLFGVRSGIDVSAFLKKDKDRIPTSEETKTAYDIASQTKGWDEMGPDRQSEAYVRALTQITSGKEASKVKALTESAMRKFQKNPGQIDDEVLGAASDSQRATLKEYKYRFENKKPSTGFEQFKSALSLGGPPVGR